jgi:hypothetical protein
VVTKHEHHHLDDKIGSKPSNPLSDFLNPNSMITPGAAGAFTMMITNTLCQQFTGLHLGLTGLVVSFLFGAVVFGAGVSIPARMMYYVINSLIIFTVAMGSNAIGDQAAEHGTKQHSTDIVSQMIGSRTAGDFNVATVQKPPASGGGTTTSQPNKPSGEQQPPPEKPRFFRRWF